MVLALAGCAAGPRPLDLAAPSAVEELAGVFAAVGLATHVIDDTSLVLAREVHTDHNVIVFIENGGQSLQAVLACPWRTAAVDMRRIARWNATRRFGRAYLDEDRKPVLAADLALDPTVTRATVQAWGQLVLDLADQFVLDVWPPRSSG